MHQVGPSRHLRNSIGKTPHFSSSANCSVLVLMTTLVTFSKSVHCKQCCQVCRVRGAVNILISWGIKPCRIMSVPTFLQNVLPPFSGYLNNFLRVDAEVIRKRKLVDYVRRLCGQSDLWKGTISFQSV